MGNNLHKVEKDLRSIAKRYKSVKYSLGLAILFLMLGVSAFSEEVSTDIATREELKTSVETVQTKLNVLKDQNKEKIKDLRLELIQLMEQGDQVVKSPWSSWQFGANYFYESWGSSYKGSGDKAQKYFFNGIYTRSDWKVRNAMDSGESQKVGSRPLTPGKDSQSTWRNAGSISNGGVTITRDTSIGSSTNGNRNWGLVNLEELKEPTNEVEILARISPKEVTKQPISLNITEPVVDSMQAPEVRPQVNTPLNAPVIKLPVIESVTINKLNINAPSTPSAPNAPSISIGIAAPSAPGAPTAPQAPNAPGAPSISVGVTPPSAPKAPKAPTAPGAPKVPTISVSPSTPGSVSAPTITINVTPPSITALNIATPGTVGKIGVAAPTVTAVDFILTSGGLSGIASQNFSSTGSNNDYSKFTTPLVSVNKTNQYISTWGYVKNLNNITTNINVNTGNTRAFMVDEGIAENNTDGIVPFRYIGTINLNATGNVGIDVQGTHTSYDDKGHGVNKGSTYNNLNSVANVKVTNAGTIIGNTGTGIKNQIGFGFNNFDASTNNTRTEMINVGTITLNAPESAGIQLRPENPNAQNNKSHRRGLNMMTAYNATGGIVTLNGKGSFGMLTVQNKSGGNPVASKDYVINGVKISTLPGGQIASRAQKENMSYMKNTGIINVNGDSSIGVGHLHNIQAVYAGGTISVAGNGSVGVYTTVATRPVLAGAKDDHGLTNTTTKTVGTETVEVSADITVSGNKSSGVFAKENGSITLKNNLTNADADSDNKTTGKITVSGKNSYGAVSQGIKLDLEKGTSISVTGQESIGYALQSGTGSNRGEIKAVGHSGNTAGTPFKGSLAFYGEKGTFTNEKEGTISSSGNIAHAVALVGDTTDGIIFNNNGKIETTGKGNIGVYADEKYTFNHSGANATINVGTNALGIYAKNANGTLNINAPIVLSASGTGANAGTTIGIYSDGNAKVNFGQNSKLTIGKGAVGLYSSDATKFANTFKVITGKSLVVELGQNSTFGLLSGTTGSVNVGTYLTNNTINISSFGSGASLFYTTGGVSSILDKNYTVTNGAAASTAVLVGAKGSTVKVDTGKTLTTNTNVGLIATKAGGTSASTALNSGNIVSTRNSGIGIYTNESTGTSSGTITMQNKVAVGILGEDNSTLTNSGKIELLKEESAGIYGKDSDITNSGTGSNGIYTKDKKSAGIYALLTSAATADKTINNSGLVKVETAAKSGSAGIYSKLDSTATKKLSTSNSGTIEVAQSGSAGIYAKNESSQINTKSDVTNSGLVKMSGADSVGIIGEKSQVTNSGTGVNKGIEISGAGSAGILASNNSKVINSGRIEGKTGASLVGISVDTTSTVTNTGTITMGTASNSGIASKGGDVTNSGEITLIGASSTGISAENANVTNSATTGKIIVKNANSMGIYSKSDGSAARTVSNAGEITLETPTGVTPNKSAAIYSLLDAGTNKLTTTNTGTINVGQEGSAGIFAKNNTATNTNSVVENKAAINVTKAGSAGILGEKSDITNAPTTGIITLSALKSAGIIGNTNSKVSNAGKIQTSGVTPTKAEDGLVGISLKASTGTNETTGTITLGTAYSTGMYGEIDGSNKSTLTNAGTITGDKQNSVGMAVKGSDATNNSGATITLSGADSTGMFGLVDGSNKSTLTNSGTINGNGTGAVGMAANKSTATNSSGATINLIALKSTGIFGEATSVVSNAGTIETKNIQPTKIEDGLVGIALDSSTGTNETTGKIILGTAYSTGMFGEKSSTLTNKGSITGSKNNIVGMAAKASTATNNAGATITLSGTDSTGMFGEANGSNKSTVTNSGTITGKGVGTVGIAVDNSTAINSNRIDLEANKSTGIFGKAGSVVSNAGTIETKVVAPGVQPTNSTEGSVGIALNASTGTNESGATITLGTAYSTGMYGEASSTLKNEGTITGDKEKAVGMAVKASTATNSNVITLTGANATGMYGETVGSTKSNLTNDGTITATGEGSVGVAVDGAIAKNNAGKVITLQAKKSTGMYGKAASEITNYGKIEMKSATPTNTTEGLVGIAVNASTAINETSGEIEIKTAYSTGIFGEANGSNKSVITNKGKITGTQSNIVGIAINKSEATNNSGASITIEGNSSTGIFGKASSKITNAGKIEMKSAAPTSTTEGLVGIAADASTVTNETTGEIEVKTAYSTGIFGKANSTLTNKGKIAGSKNNVVGIAADASTVANNSGASITIEGNSSTGIFGAAASNITNAGKIEMKSAAPTSTTEGLVGIALNASTGTNTSTGEIKIGTAYSTGIFGAAVSTLINEGKITGDKENSVGMAGNNSKVTNKKTITLEAKNSTGIFGENNSTLLNDTNGVITVKEESSVGIYSKENSKVAENKGIILTVKKASAGMLGNKASLENNHSITTQDEKSAGMYVENANAKNKKNINIDGKESAGVYVKLNEPTGGALTGINEGANAEITMSKEKSAAMLGLVDSAVTSNSATLTLTNQNNIVVNTEQTVGMMLTNEANAVSRDNVKAVNTGTINLNASTTNKDNIGILANKRATGINEKIINVNSNSSVGMLAKEGSNIENNTTSANINLTAVAGIGMLADGKDANNNISVAVNNAKITATSTGTKSLGMLAKDNGKVENAKTIEILAQQGVGIFITETGIGKNRTTGTITLENTEAVGIFAKNNGSTYTAENAGTITLGKANKTTTQLSLIGMFAQADASKTASVKNTGIININTKASVGIYAKNGATNATAVDLQNTGTINVNNSGSAGIYAPNSNISKVGKINLENSTATNGSSAVYISEGGKVSDTSSAQINLGKINQNRVAYYVNGAGATLSGANIGKISGYGVGVYLQGNSPTDVAKIDNNTPTLNYTTGDDKGDGIIGLFLNGDTNIQSYANGITVGNTIKNENNPNDRPKYAIGIYANTQGTPGGTAYNITTSIKAGKDGVGIYADRDSNIKYTGNMEIGDGTTAGTGIFITKKQGTVGGKVELGANTIKLKGTGGVAVIASEGTNFDGKNATIELEGTNVQGVGVYAKKGSRVDISTWTFNNHGNQAEEVRSEEGGAYITANKQLKPKMVLTHVINGETSIASGKSVTSVNDGTKYKAEENIGLMAEGIKSPTAPSPITWQEGNFEAVNYGTIDFSAAEKSTAIFVNSARAKNDGIIKVGKNSTAIYGFYNKDTRKYDGAPSSPDPNKLELETTANSKISLGDKSTGMYLINASKINNIGGQITSESGATRNVGIYAINGQESDNANNKVLTMTTATNITLGKGSVGLYSKGQSTTAKNTVTNTGNITVGDKITVSKTENYPAVAMYAENTNLNTNSTVTVGNDGIAFYGKHSDITVKGTVNFSNNGVLAYLENSKFVSHLGNLGATKNTMIYIKNSIAQLDGAGTKVDVEVADGYTGAYVEGNSQLTGIKTIKLGKDSTGLYLQDTTPNFVSTAESITGTKDKAKGISAVNSNFTNNSKISLSGAESVALYSKNSSANTKYIVNNGELNLSGKKTLGAFLKGKQTFENKANINIADSVDSKNPTIGIYTVTSTEQIKNNAGVVIGTRVLEGADVKHTSGTIEVGEKSIGIYSKTPSNVEVSAGKIHVKDQGIGIYKENGKVILKGQLEIDKHTATAKDSEPTGVYAVNGANVDDKSSKISVGAKSYGFILNNTSSTKTNIYTSGNTGTVSLGNESVFLYSNGKADIVNNRRITSNGSEHLIAFYIKNGGDFTNNGTIDFSTGKGNIGIYAPGGKATNTKDGRVLVGKTDDIDPATGKVYSDVSKIVYGIGMAADNGGHIINEGEIRIYNNKSIGMYGAGAGTLVENKGNINLDGSKATATDKIQSMTGVYVDEGAIFRNFGTIKTTDSYAGRDGKINENVSGLTGVAVMNGSTLENHGKILIDADNSSGVVIRGKRDSKGNLIRNAVIKNYGEIRVRGKGVTAISWKDVSAADITELQKMLNTRISADPSGRELGQASGTNKEFKGVEITVQNGLPVFKRDGKEITNKAELETINNLIGTAPNLAMSDVGFYVDTLGKTRPVTFEGANPPVNSQLIIGTEYSEQTNAKQWFVTGNVIKPFLDQIQGRNFKLTTLAGSLTWIATPVLDNYGQITGVAMSKLSYTSFVKPSDNAYNFTDGLEQRYNMNDINTPEKRIFNKLNSIGKNEDSLLTQAYDEMMGHQYANVQQRVQATGKILDKEFNHLRDSWSNPSKDSNKVKTFGMKGEYKTDTAGVIDYKYDAYGVAYVHENEDIKLGRGTGWYTGIVHNTFKFKDIGNSKEKQLQAKVGIFKSVPFDDNNSLNWTISGDIFAGYNKLERKFLVVDEIFHAKAKYHVYGIGIKNEIGKEFRLSEGFSVRPYGAVKVEYGRVSKIREKSGEMKLEVKGNDYLSISPEIGTELSYKHYFGTKTLTASVGVAYENELGRVANGKNKARVAGTTADWFNIRGEKEDRRGNIKVDFNVGLDNQRFGVTGNVGYDTKGSAVRGGVGLRVIF